MAAATAVDLCSAGGADKTARYQFEAAVQYYADATDASTPNAATDWTAQVTATDAEAASDAGSNTAEIDSLIALDIDASVNYGTVLRGAVSNEQSVTITNAGNRAMNAEISADDNMACTDGTIAVTAVKYSLNQGFVYASAGTALTLIDANIGNQTAARTNDAAASTTPLYLRIQIPGNGASGACSNFVTLTATAYNP